MGILIKGIKIPKNCGDCPFCTFTADEKRYIGYCNTSDDDYYCKVLDRFMEYDEVDGGVDILGKPDDCPLVEVPTPHGRLIDADELYADIINGIRAGNLEEGYERYQNINDVYDCADCVRYADTVIEAEGEQCNKALCSFDISPKDEYAIKVERASLEAYKEQLENMPSAQPATNCSEIPNSSTDCISRQAAIDTLARMMPRSYTPDGSHPADEEIYKAQEIYVDCIESIEILPAVQPEIIRCKDCKHRDKYGCCKYWKGLAMGDIPIATDDYDFCSYAKRI